MVANTIVWLDVTEYLDVKDIGHFILDRLQSALNNAALEEETGYFKKTLET